MNQKHPTYNRNTPRLLSLFMAKLCDIVAVDITVLPQNIWFKTDTNIMYKAPGSTTVGDGELQLKRWEKDDIQKDNYRYHIYSMIFYN